MYIFLNKVEVFTFVKFVPYVIVDSKPSQFLSGIIISKVGNEFLSASYVKNRRDKKRWFCRYIMRTSLEYTKDRKEGVLTIILFESALETTKEDSYLSKPRRGIFRIDRHKKGLERQAHDDVTTIAPRSRLGPCPSASSDLLVYQFSQGRDLN